MKTFKVWDKVVYYKYSFRPVYTTITAIEIDKEFIDYYSANLRMSSDSVRLATEEEIKKYFI